MNLFKLGKTCFRNPFCESNASRKKEENYFCISDTFLHTQSVSKGNTASDEQDDGHTVDLITVGVANVKIQKKEADSNSRNSSSAVYSCITPLSSAFFPIIIDQYLEHRNNEDKIPNNCNVVWGRKTDTCEEELIEIARNETPGLLPDHEILESFRSEATACISVNVPEKTVGSHFISQKCDSKELQVSSIDNKILEDSSIESGDNDICVDSVTCAGHSILHHPKSDESNANERSESLIEEFLRSSSSVSNSNKTCSNTKIDCVSGNVQETLVLSQPPAVVSETCETQLQSSSNERSFNTLTVEIDIENSTENSLVCLPISNECDSNETHELSNGSFLQSASSLSNPIKACSNSRVDCVSGNGEENRDVSYPLAVISETSEIQLQSSSHEESLNNVCDTFTVEIEIGNGAGNSLESHAMSVENGNNNNKKNEPSIDKEILQPSSNESSLTIPSTNVMVDCKYKNCQVNSAISDKMETSNLEDPILPLPCNRRRGNRQSAAVVIERDSERDQQFPLDSHCATIESGLGVSTKSDALPVSSQETLNRASGSPTESYDKSFYVGSLIKESILVVNNIDNFNTSEALLNHLCYASEYQAHDNNGAHSSAHYWSSDAEVNTFLSTEDLQCHTSSNVCTDNSFGLLMSGKTESLFKAKVANNQLSNSSFGNTVHNKSNLKLCLKQPQRKGKLKIDRPAMKSTQTQGRKKQRSIDTKHMLAFQLSDLEETSDKCNKVTQNSSSSSQLSTKVKEITKSFITPNPKKIYDRDPVSVHSENQSALRKSAEVPEEHFSETVGTDDNNNKETAALKSSAISAGSSEEPKRLEKTNSNSEKHVPKLFAAFSHFIQAVPKPVPSSSEHEASHIDRRDAWKKIFELAKARQKRM